MIIRSLRVSGFRSLKDVTLSFEPGRTILAGENGTGKSTVGLALQTLFLQGISDNDCIGTLDYPYGVRGSIAIDTALELTTSELEEFLIRPLTPGEDASNLDSPLRKWLQGQGNVVQLSLGQPRRYPRAVLKWGDLNISRSQVSAGTISPINIGPTWTDVAQQVAGQILTPARVLQQMRANNFQYSVDADISSIVSAAAQTKLKKSSEFRSPSAQGQRTEAVESMGGSETASVLLSLKNHSVPSESARYDQVVEAYSSFFPRYHINVVEESPGSNRPNVQFFEPGQTSPLSLGQVSAGSHEILTLITNLIGRDGLIMFLEHPENNLHPQAIRVLDSLPKESSQRNQIIIATHHPYFVDPKAPTEIRRFWWTADKHTQVKGMEGPLSETVALQVDTALRLTGNREVVFSRAVLLVEDESISEFTRAVAPRIGYDLDSHGVSIIFTGGHGGHKPFHTVLDGLSIPHINLRDMPWGNNPNYPPEQYLALGSEFEEFIDRQGLASLRQQLIESLGGNSHRRIAAALGEQIEPEQVPEVFHQVLKAAINTATGEPSN